MENQQKQNISGPHIQVFGEEIESKEKGRREDCHHHNHHCPRCHHHSIGGGTIWGLGIIFAGVLLLLNNTGAVSKEIWNYILPFWPILLVLVGIRIILGFGWVSHFIVSLLTLAIFCFISLYGLVMVNSPLINYWHLPAEFINFISQFK